MMEEEQAYEEVVPEQMPQEKGGTSGRKAAGHKKLYVALGIMAAIVALLVATCPSRQSHSEAVKDVLREAVEQQKGVEHNEWTVVRAFFASTLVNAAVDNMLEVDNYGVCSIGRAHVGGKTKTLSFGILGHVFTFSVDDIAKIEDES